MQISWFTVIAQVINFFVLVWLLKRFLYKPILKAIDEREGKITAELKDADAKKAEAIKAQDEFKAKNETFDQEKKGMLEKAVTDVKKERERLLQEVRSDVSTLRSKLEKSHMELQADKEREISQKTQQEIFAVARKTLIDLGSVPLEEQLTRAFINKLKNLKEEERKQFSEAFKSETKPVQLRSAFDLTDEMKIKIKEAVTETLGAETQFEFATAPELVGGIELTANGFRLAWSIAAYLNSFERSISETINENPKSEFEKV